MVKYFISFLSIFIQIVSIAQPEVELQKFKEKYPGEHVVILNISKHVDISVNKEGSLDILRTSTEERFLLNQKSASQYGSDNVSYSHFYELEDIVAYTLVPNGKKYDKVSVEEFTTKDELGGSVFHDDVKIKSFFFPSLQEGAKTFLEHKTRIIEPRFLTGFYFASYAPLEKATYTLEADNEVELVFNYFNTDETTLNFTKEVGKKRTIYTWSTTENKKFKREDNSVPAQAYLPHIVTRIKGYSNNGSYTPILGSINDLHNWYYDLVRTVNAENNPKLQSIADSVTKGLTTNDEKAKAIYYWVQDNIKYIAMEAGLGGFIPAEATEVCNNKYGDCKGMSSLTNSLLKHAGIESYLTWIGSRDITYTYSDVPSPVVDNHMICTYIDSKGSYHFLDATGSEVPFDLTTSFIQGKEALINKGEKNFEIQTVPVYDRSTNIEVDTTYFTIDGTGKILGKTNYSSKGLGNIFARRRLKGKTNDEIRKYITSFNQKGNNKFIVDSFEVENVYNRDLPLNIYLDYTIEDYVTSNNGELYVNMHLDKLFQEHKIDEKTENPIEIDYKSTNFGVTYLDIPEGYAISFIPENDTYNNDMFGYNISYTKESDDRIRLNVELFENYLVLQPEQFNDWNKMIKKLKNNYSETVILKKTQ